MTIINKEQLYIEIWDEPLAKVAEKYNVQTYKLKEVCNKLSIPTPNSGHWTKVAYNKVVKQKQLPKITSAQETTYDIASIQKGSTQREVLTELNENYSKELTLAKKILQFKNHMNNNPLIKNSKSILKNRKQEKYGRVASSTEENCLDINVSQPMAGIALKIMSQICYWAKLCGFEIASNTNTVTGSQIDVNGIFIKFSIIEKAIQSEHIPTKEELSRTYFYCDKYDYTPSGRLILKIDEWVFMPKELRRIGTMYCQALMNV